MTSKRVHLHDTGWPGRSAIIEHNPESHDVTITISGPSGGIHGQLKVPEGEAVEAFRDIIGSVTGIGQRRPLGGDLGGKDD